MDDEPALGLGFSASPDVADGDVFGRQDPGHEQPAMAVFRILLRAHDRNSHALQAVPQPTDAFSEELSRGDAVVAHPSVGKIQSRVVWSPAKVRTHPDIGDSGRPERFGERSLVEPRRIPRPWP